MSVRLSIRCFSGASFEHSHDFPQLVITLRGAAKILLMLAMGVSAPVRALSFLLAASIVASLTRIHVFWWLI